MQALFPRCQLSGADDPASPLRIVPSPRRFWMAKRIIVSIVVTLALTFSPSLAFSLPTKTVKKKTSSSNTQREDCRKSKSAKKSNYSSRHSRRDSGEVVESSMVPQAGASVHETAPLMKVNPQRDGGFLIEPLEPKKNGA